MSYFSLFLCFFLLLLITVETWEWEVAYPKNDWENSLKNSVNKLMISLKPWNNFLTNLFSCLEISTSTTNSLLSSWDWILMFWTEIWFDLLIMNTVPQWTDLQYLLGLLYKDSTALLENVISISILKPVCVSNRCWDYSLFYSRIRRNFLETAPRKFCFWISNSPTWIYILDKQFVALIFEVDWVGSKGAHIRRILSNRERRICIMKSFWIVTQRVKNEKRKVFILSHHLTDNFFSGFKTIEMNIDSFDKQNTSVVSATD